MSLALSLLSVVVVFVVLGIKLRVWYAGILPVSYTLAVKVWM